MDILGDPTGNRRIIPIEIPEKMDFDLYNSIDKKALWMEAYHLYKGGFEWRLTDKDVKLLSENTQEFVMPDPVQEMILKYFEPPEPGNDQQYVVNYTPTEIAEYLNARSHGHKINPRSLGQRLKNLGFYQKVQKIEGSTYRLYAVIEKEHAKKG